IFATRIAVASGRAKFEVVGEPYRRLLEDLIAAPVLRPYGLAEASAAGRAPKDEGGFNIEGLAATPEGHLLIGLRNPVPQGRALVVPLLNPAEIIRGQRARLGEPALLDLAGRGIRDLVGVGREYFILAGEPGDNDRSSLSTQLFRWAGDSAAPVRLAEFP